MSFTYVPVIFENDKFSVNSGLMRKDLTNQITIYESSNGGYTNIGSLGQNENAIKQNFIPNKYFVKTEDLKLGLGGNKSKRRKFRYRFSSKKRVASHRRSRGRGRQTRYSRRK